MSRSLVGILTVFVLLNSAACVCFKSGEPLPIAPGHRGPLGQDVVLQALGRRGLADTTGLAVRIVSQRFYEYGLTISHTGEVKYVGGFGVICSGSLRRKVGAGDVRRVLADLRARDFPPSRFRPSDPRPSHSSVVHLGFRTADGGWREIVFVDQGDEEGLLDAAVFVEKAVGAHHLNRSREAYGPGPDDCSHRPFFF